MSPSYVASSSATSSARARRASPAAYASPRPDLQDCPLSAAGDGPVGSPCSAARASRVAALTPGQERSSCRNCSKTQVELSAAGRSTRSSRRWLRRTSAILSRSGIPGRRQQRSSRKGGLSSRAAVRTAATASARLVLSNHRRTSPPPGAGENGGCKGKRRPVPLSA